MYIHGPLLVNLAQDVVEEIVSVLLLDNMIISLLKFLLNLTDDIQLIIFSKLDISM